MMFIEDTYNTTFLFAKLRQPPNCKNYKHCLFRLENMSFSMDSLMVSSRCKRMSRLEIVYQTTANCFNRNTIPVPAGGSCSPKHQLGELMRPDGNGLCGVVRSTEAAVLNTLGKQQETILFPDCPLMRLARLPQKRKSVLGTKSGRW